MDPSEARETEVAARAEGVSVNEFVREALAARITEAKTNRSNVV
jgi:predicted HicB family RNase H-like nuclease